MEEPEHYSTPRFKNQDIKIDILEIFRNLESYHVY